MSDIDDRNFYTTLENPTSSTHEVLGIMLTSILLVDAKPQVETPIPNLYFKSLIAESFLNLKC